MGRVEPAPPPPATQTAAPAGPAAETPEERRARRRRGGAADAVYVPWIPPPYIRSTGWFLSRMVLKRWFDLRFEGREHIPKKGPALIISNHPSYIDPFLVGQGAPSRWITWMAWEEAFGWSGVGTIVRGMGALPVNIERPSPSTIKSALGVLAEGRLLGMFFEGHRSMGFDLDPPKRGGARLALMAGVPVLPVSVAGCRKLWPRDRAWPAPGRVVITYHPPVDPALVLPGSPAKAREEKLTQLLVDAIRSKLPPDGHHQRR